MSGKRGNPLSKKSLTEFVRQSRQQIKLHEAASQKARWANNQRDESYHEGMRIGMSQMANDLVTEYGLTEDKEI